MITDRDITVRAVGAGKGPDTPIREIMSKEVKYCFEDDELDEVAENMADIKVRRLPVHCSATAPTTRGGRKKKGRSISGPSPGRKRNA